MQDALERHDAIARNAVATAHGTVVMISDWLDPLDKFEAVVRHSSNAGVRGHIMQVLDPAEEELPFNGHVKFEGLESEGQHTIRRVETVRQAYGARLAAQARWKTPKAKSGSEPSRHTHCRSRYWRVSGMVNLSRLPMSAPRWIASDGLPATGASRTGRNSYHA